MVGKLRICKTVAKSIDFSNRIKAVGKTHFSSSEAPQRKHFAFQTKCETLALTVQRSLDASSLESKPLHVKLVDDKEISLGMSCDDT